MVRLQRRARITRTIENGAPRWGSACARAISSLCQYQTLTLPAPNDRLWVGSRHSPTRVENGGYTSAERGLLRPNPSRVGRGSVEPISRRELNGLLLRTRSI